MKTVHRLISGLSLGALWAVALWFHSGPILFAAFLLCSSLSQWEFYTLAERGGYFTCRWLGLLLGAAWLTAVFAFPNGGPAGGPLGGDRWECLLIAGGGLLILTRLLFDPRVKQPFIAGAITLLGMFYVPYLLSFFIRLAQDGVTTPWVLSRGGVFVAFYLALVVKLSDVGAYATGMMVGRHKMFPRISPGKSWEGLAGGIAAAVATSVITVAIARHFPAVPQTFISHMSYARAAAVAVLLAGVGVIGDLAESMLKRAVNVKDSSAALPGMGGLLDVFDSLLFTAAIFFFIIPWLQP
jgi:phosphatidate cytidylyltransferase